MSSAISSSFLGCSNLNLPVLLEVNLILDLFLPVAFASALALCHTSRRVLAFKQTVMAVARLSILVVGGQTLGLLLAHNLVVLVVFDAFSGLRSVDSLA